MNEATEGHGGIYIASRTRHAPKWHEARDSGVLISATWIDEAGPGESASMADLWRRCVDEARGATATVLYREGNEPLKGALIEAGAALGAGKPVFAVGFNGDDDMKTFSFLCHPMVIRCETVGLAFALAGALMVPPGGGQGERTEAAANKTLTPQAYLAVEEEQQAIIDAAESKINEARSRAAQCPPPPNLRPATAADIVVGAIIWYPRTDEEDGSYWNVVEQVLYPDDDFKAYVSEGARYGLRCAFVEEEGGAPDVPAV